MDIPTESSTSVVDGQQNGKDHEVDALVGHWSRFAVSKPQFEDAFDELDFYWTSQRFMELAPPTPSTPAGSSAFFSELSFSTTTTATFSKSAVTLPKEPLFMRRSNAKHITPLKIEPVEDQVEDFSSSARPKPLREALVKAPFAHSMPASFSQSSSGRRKKGPREERCAYCLATGQDRHLTTSHTKYECPVLARLKPCAICGAHGPDNHTAMHCPERKPVQLRLRRIQPRPWLGAKPPKVTSKRENRARTVT